MEVFRIFPYLEIVIFEIVILNANIYPGCTLRKFPVLMIVNRIYQKSNDLKVSKSNTAMQRALIRLEMWDTINSSLLHTTMNRP